MSLGLSCLGNYQEYFMMGEKNNDRKDKGSKV